MKNVTIYDVAKEANCSPATVSLVFKKSERIKPDTHKRVLDAAKKLNYTPNIIAQSLITRETRTLGVIVPNIENPLYSCMISGVEECANKNGYDIILGISDSESEKESHHLDMLAKKRIDGLVLFPTFIDAIKNKLENSLAYNIPIVLCGSSGKSMVNTDYVKCDNHAGSFSAINHLIDKGCRKIGCIFPVHDKKQSESRLAGYQDSLADNGIAYDENLIKYCSMDNDSIYNATQELLDSQHPDALFCLYDYCASIVVSAILHKGLRIPEDIAVMGYDNIPLSQFFPIPLSTVDTHGNQVGQRATELLIEKIKDPNLPVRQILLKPDLIVRQSTERK